MVNPYVAGVVAAGVGIKAYKHLTTTKHDRLLAKTYDELESAGSGDHTLYVDHISRSSASGRPAEINGHRPDIAFSDFANANLLVEVETADTLDPTAASQLAAFRKPGSKRVLVVPESVVPEAEVFVEDVDGDVYVCPPGEVVGLL